jgi:hypothetical protein
MIYVKVHRSPGEVLVAVCDREILGRCFSEGDIRLEVSKAFYKGELVSLGRLSEFLSNASMANLTGNWVVGEALDLGFLSEEHILEVSGVKHAQIIIL